MYAGQNDQLSCEKLVSGYESTKKKYLRTFCFLATVLRYLITSKLAVESKPLVGSCLSLLTRIERRHKKYITMAVGSMD